MNTENISLYSKTGSGNLTTAGRAVKNKLRELLRSFVAEYVAQGFDKSEIEELIFDAAFFDAAGEA